MKKLVGTVAASVLFAALLNPVAASAEGPSSRTRKIVPGRGTATPSFVRGIEARAIAADAPRAARAFLASNETTYRIDAPAEDLETLEVTRDEDMTTVRFAQSHDGVPVFGAQYIVNLERESTGFSPTATSGHYFTDISVDTTPRVSEQDAEGVARGHLLPASIDRVERHGLFVLPQGSGALTYHFSVWGTRYGNAFKREIFVSAKNARIALDYNGFQAAEGPYEGRGRTAHGDLVDPLHVYRYEKGNGELQGYYMKDASRTFAPGAKDPVIITCDAKRQLDLYDCSTPGGSPRLLSRSDDSTFNERQHAKTGAVDAHHGAGLTFEYFKSLGRNSIDDKGMRIVSTVNALDSMGSLPYNAFWTGEQMVYGNPYYDRASPRQVYPFSADLDIVAHELTHGVTQHTAGLIYLNQSGALNEAMSDYFGQAVDNPTMAGSPATNGLIGEDMCAVRKPDLWECPLRDLNDGRTTDDYLHIGFELDNGGVHLNSTIFAGALWDIREALGGAVADPIVYRALRDHMTPLTNFYEARLAVQQAAEDVGATPSQKNAIAAAFDMKKITQGWDSGQVPTAQGDVLRGDVYPLGYGYSPPRLDGPRTRWTISDFGAKQDFYDDVSHIFVGRVNDSEPPRKINGGYPRKTANDEQPDIAGDRAVWTRVSLGTFGLSTRVVTRTIGSELGEVTRVDTGRGVTTANADISGNRIVWERTDPFTGASDIYTRRVGKKVRPVANSSAPESSPQVAGAWVAYLKLSGRGTFIGMKNMVTRKTALVGTTRGALGPPSIADGYVYYYQNGDYFGTGSIKRVKLGTTKVETLVRKNHPLAPIWNGDTAGEPTPTANGRYVTWHDERGLLEFFGHVKNDGQPEGYTGRKLYIHNLETGATGYVRTQERGDMWDPQMARGRRVVYYGGTYGRSDLLTLVGIEP